LIELLDEWFTNPAVRAAVGAPGVIGLRQGPRSGGTALLLLYHHMGQRSAAGVPAPGIVRGGIGKLTQALADSARGFGVEIRTSARVEQVILQNGRAVGVALADGQEFRARMVISSANPRRTFTELVDTYELPPTFNRAVENIRFRGAAAKVNLALNRLPRFHAVPEGDPTLLRGRIQIGPSLTYIEQAYDAAKYGRFSSRPFLDITIPTLHDPTLAPPGKHTMSILAQYAPYALREGSWEECRDAFGETVIDTLAEYAPDIRETIIHRQVLTPVDLETTYGLAEGNLYHGEMMLDQLLYMRPVPGWAGYRTPISGLYLCGAGCQPGGGVTGEPGRLAAQVIIQDAGKS
jgi:phytoene dehydrogenase-like protein